MPEEQKERLKKEISIQRLAEARGIKLRRSGKELIGLCPFHDDRNPSLSIDPVKNVWDCKGACGEGGDVIRWVARAEGISDTHALELLKGDYLPMAAGPIQAVKKCTVPKLPAPVTADGDDQALMTRVVDFYHRTLKASPEAVKYLAGRGITSSEVIDRFKLGFSNRSLGLRLPAKNRAAGKAIRGRLEALGIFRDTGHERFSGSLVVPVITPAGEVLEMYGRKITRMTALRSGTEAHMYLPGPMRGVWNEEALIASKEIILCEALIDALTFWSAGFRNVTASYGANGFTKDHRAAFERHGIERVYIAYDRDEAGDKAAAKLAEELIEMGIDCYRVEFPKGMDANEYALKVTPAAKSLGVLLNRASWLGKGKRPASRVIVPVTVAPSVVAQPEIVAAPEQKQAAKEKMIEEAVPEPAFAAAVEARIAEEEFILAEIEAEIEAAAVASIEPSPEPAATASPAAIPEHVLPLAAALAPVAPLPPQVENKIDVPFEMRGEDVMMRFGDREYRVRGLAENTSTSLLKVNLRVMGVNVHGDMALHVDTLDLNAARPRMAFSKQAAEELGIKEGIISRDLGQVWMKLEELRDERIREALAPKETAVNLTDEERGEAMKLLRDPRLLERIVEDFAVCGMVGEETNKLMAYLGTVSRHLENPLAILVQSSSAAGKSSLMDAVLAFVPEEQRVQYSAITGQSLFYMGEVNLKNKILAIAEEEGAARAAYPLKLLQSEGKLNIASTGKDPVSGKLITHEYKVEGPVMIFLTTTASTIDEELLNRCVVLTVNEDREQTQAIHRIQREAQTIEGLLRRSDRAELLRLHCNAQRLLKPIPVANPYARGLTFLDGQTRTRRDHAKYLTLIRAIALLHQHQRPRLTRDHKGKPFEYIEATLDDIAIANRLTGEVLGRSLDDLAPQTRRLLLLVDQMVTAECKRQRIERTEYRFSRRDVRTATGWGDTQLREHLTRLEQMEYLLAHRGGRGQSFVYELVFVIEGDGSRPTMPGLIDVEKLRSYKYDGNLAGGKAEFAGPTRGQNGGIAVGARSEPSSVSMRVAVPFYEDALKIAVPERVEENRVVAVQPRSMNGNEHHAGVTTWPA
jgi:DNA primase catalytic core